VKLLFDENISPRLAGVLLDIYPGSAHVHNCGLGSANDVDVWQYARDNDFTIVSKDSDFQERSILLGAPPKVIWLRTTNCTSAEIESLLRAALPAIKRFIQEDQESCLVLGLRPPVR
jgi:predicted nuclease of predicted toxin-antitoxin system